MAGQPSCQSGGDHPNLLRNMASAPPKTPEDFRARAASCERVAETAISPETLVNSDGQACRITPVGRDRSDRERHRFCAYPLQTLWLPPAKKTLQQPWRGTQGWSL